MKLNQSKASIMPIGFPPVVELPIKSAYLKKKLTLNDLMISIMLDAIPWYEFSIGVCVDKTRVPFCALAKQGVKRMYRIPDVCSIQTGCKN